MQNLSGGELQRVALTLCLGKPADVYLIDEPSAYLDSEQRLMAARVIKRFFSFLNIRYFLLIFSLTSTNCITLFSISTHKPFPAFLLLPTMHLTLALFFFADTSYTRRRQLLWWSTTLSWQPTWPTESSCSTAFPPRRPRLIRKSQKNLFEEHPKIPMLSL